jgi:hypothetical protein
MSGEGYENKETLNAEILEYKKRIGVGAKVIDEHSKEIQRLNSLRNIKYQEQLGMKVGSWQ